MTSTSIILYFSFSVFMRALQHIVSLGETFDVITSWFNKPGKLFCLLHFFKFHCSINPSGLKRLPKRAAGCIHDQVDQHPALSISCTVSTIYSAPYPRVWSLVHKIFWMDAAVHQVMMVTQLIPEIQTEIFFQVYHTYPTQLTETTFMLNFKDLKREICFIDMFHISIVLCLHKHTMPHGQCCKRKQLGSGLEKMVSNNNVYHVTQSQ